MDTSGEGSLPQHIRMKAVQLAPNAFNTRIIGVDLVLMRNNATVGMCLKEQGGMVLLEVYKLALDIITWSELHMVSSSVHILGSKTFSRTS